MKIRKKLSLFLFLISIIGILLFPLTAHAYNPIATIGTAYEAKVTRGVHGNTGTAYDFSDSGGSQVYFRASVTTNWKIRGVVDNVITTTLYYKDANNNLVFSHYEKDVYVKVQVAYSSSDSWVDMGRILYAHLDYNSAISQGSVISPNTQIGRNSTSHQGTGDWYRSNGQLASTGPHLHLERWQVYSGWSSTVMSLSVGTTYPAGTTVYRFEYNYPNFPTRLDI
jgi:hypothetical protein